MKQKYLLVLIIFLIALGASLYFSTQKKAPVVPVVAPVIISESLPQAGYVPNEPKNVVFKYTGPKINLPAELPLVSVSPLLASAGLDNTLLRLGKQFSLTGTPSAYIQNQDYYASWVSGPAQLSLNKSSDSLTFAYELTLPSPSQVVLSGSAPEQNIINLIQGAVGNALSLNLQSKRTTGFEGLVIRDVPQPALTGFSFSYVYNGYRIMTANYAFLGAEAVVDGTQRLRTLSVAIPPVPQQPGTNIKLLTLDSALANLNLGRGALVSYTNPDTEEMAAYPSFNSVDLRGVEIIWLWSQNTFRPAYYFTGTGMVSGQPTHSVSYVLPATPQ